MKQTPSNASVCSAILSSCACAPSFDPDILHPAVFVTAFPSYCPFITPLSIS